MRDAVTNEPKKRALPRFLGLVVFAFFFIFADQITKTWIAENFLYGDFRYITSFLNICYVRNTGAAFSFLSDAGGWQTVVFSAFAIALSFAILFYVWCHMDELFFSVSLMLIFSGAIGNVIDRMTKGSVIDFIDLHYSIYHWPAFNVADILICTGAALIVLNEFFGKKRL